VRTLIDRGWEAADTSPGKAVTLFEQALGVDPSSHEAMYGYGYALLKKGDLSGAGTWLCKARGSGQIDIQREVSGLIEQHGIACP
jgi:Flp pilus assembly protein TadD